MKLESTIGFMITDNLACLHYKIPHYTIKLADKQTENIQSNVSILNAFLCMSEQCVLITFFIILNLLFLQLETLRKPVSSLGPSQNLENRSSPSQWLRA